MRFSTFFCLAVVLMSMGQFAADLYLPALVPITHSLHCTVAWSQWTVTAFMLGFAISRIFYGIGSDAFGRLRLLQAGLILAGIGSVICWFAHDITLLIVGRLIQGLGAAAGTTIMGAMARDHVSGKALLRFNAKLSTVNIVIITSAPMLGAWVLHAFSWRANFAILAVYAFAGVWLAGQFLTESNVNRDRSHLHPKIILSNMKTLLSHPVYRPCVTLVFACYAGICAWLAFGPVMIVEVLKFSPHTFGVCALFCGGSFWTGGVFSGQYIERWGAHRMFRLGAMAIASAFLLLLVFGLLHLQTLFTLMLPVMLFIFGSAVIFPNAYGYGLMPFPKIAGFAVALKGSLQILGGVLASAAIGGLSHTSFLSLVWVWAGCLALIFTAVCLGSNDTHEGGEKKGGGIIIP